MSEITPLEIATLESQQTKRNTLADMEENLLALIECADTITPEQESEYLADLEVSLRSTVAKRDRVVSFIRMAEAHAEIVKKEIQRLRARQHAFERAAEATRAWVVHVIRSMGPDPKAKPVDGIQPLHKLKGNLSTMYTQALKTQVEIKDEALIPQRLKDSTVTFTLPADRMNAWIGSIAGLLPVSAYTLILNGLTDSVNKDRLRAALEAGESIDGAELVIDRLGLVIK